VNALLAGPIPPITITDGDVPDRTVLAVRPIAPADVDRMRRMFFRLSPTTVYRRFFSPIQEPSHRMLRWLTEVDHDRREALVALDGDEIVAVARYDGRVGTREAEIAVTVEDAWQHRGVGRHLARRLAFVARDHGFERFIAIMLPDNREAIGLLRKLSNDASVRLEDGTFEAVAPLLRAS
jgi:GNAT superfamily N-acetyltransferase